MSWQPRPLSARAPPRLTLALSAGGGSFIEASLRLGCMWSLKGGRRTYGGRSSAWPPERRCPHEVLAWFRHPLKEVLAQVTCR
ncbi:UNVERIFIED_CONTAM: hypothetical protein K2H54_043789 [Gekko kuhli]